MVYSQYSCLLLKLCILCTGVHVYNGVYSTLHMHCWIGVQVYTNNGVYRTLFRYCYNCVYCTIHRCTDILLYIAIIIYTGVHNSVYTAQLYTVHYILNLLYCTVYTIHCTVKSVQCIVYTVQFTLYSAQCTVHTVQCKLYCVHYTLYTVRCTLLTVQCIVSYDVRGYQMMSDGVRDCCTSPDPSETTKHYRNKM